MRIQHTVVFRLRHPAGSREERDFLDEARQTLSSIPGVEDFAVQRQVSVKSSLTWQFSMSFASRRDYEAYDAHERHRTFVADRWLHDVDEFQEYDFITA